MRNTGLSGTAGYPYCAAAVYTWHLEALGKAPMPRSALAADMVRNPTWIKGKGPAMRPGDCFGLWINGRLGHTGLVYKVESNRIVTVEANTSPDAATASQDRDASDRRAGVHSKIRWLSTIHSGKSWLP
jgi:hypothetical protein